MLSRKSTLKITISLFSSLLAVCPAVSLAQTAAPPAVAAADTVAYTLMPQDRVSVVVVNFPELSAQVTVTPDGSVELPLLNTVHVGGKTLSEVTADMRTRYKKYLVDPSVSISLIEEHKQIVSVTGFVQRPGLAEFKPGMRVLEAIAQAGGVAPTADSTRVSLTKHAGGKLTLDLDHPDKQAGTDADAVLDEGDVIYVPEQKSEVSVVGEVKAPGSVPYKNELKVLDALAVTGGVLDDADLKNSKITHDGVEQPLDLNALLRNGDMTYNVTLSKGDRILIPLAVRTYVFGAVQRPGFYTLKEGDRVLDAINGCGGTSPDASLKNIRLVRIAKDKNSAVATQLNLEDYFKKGQIQANSLLQPGDAVFVSQKQQKDSSGGLWGILNGMNILNAGARILTHGLGY